MVRTRGAPFPNSGLDGVRNQSTDFFALERDVSLWHALKMMDRKPLGGLGVLLREPLGDAHPLRQPMSAFGGEGHYRLKV